MRDSSSSSIVSSSLLQPRTTSTATRTSSTSNVLLWDDEIEEEIETDDDDCYFHNNNSTTIIECRHQQGANPIELPLEQQIILEKEQQQQQQQPQLDTRQCNSKARATTTRQRRRRSKAKANQLFSAQSQINSNNDNLSAMTAAEKIPLLLQQQQQQQGEKQHDLDDASETTNSSSTSLYTSASADFSIPMATSSLSPSSLLQTSPLTSIKSNSNRRDADEDYDINDNENNAHQPPVVGCLENTDPLQAPIIKVMDRIEDEVEAHTYEDLVPLEVKLALEDKVFGWTHLSSSFLGHTAFTVGAYLLVDQLLFGIIICPHHHCFGFIGQISYTYLEWFRIMLSLFAAISAFRMVRRRRRVWFRAAYGSKAYKQDEERRRQSVRETDKKTALGRMVQRLLERRVHKHLRKAEKYYAKRHFKHKKQAEEEQQKRQRQLEMQQLQKQQDDFTPPSRFDISPRAIKSFDMTLEDTRSSTSPGIDSCTSSSEGESTDSDFQTLSRKRRPSFHTDPTNRMHSVQHDQMLIPVIKTMPYAHGGFFGAAPFMLANPHWVSILRHLMPDVYVEISRRVANSPASRLIHWAENNPICAAYGMAHEIEYSKATPNIEWDVFLDPQLVRRVEKVLSERDNYIATLAQGSETPAESRYILAYYNHQLKRRSQVMVDKMMIAHGNLTQLITEISGCFKHFNYSRVKRTRRSLGGGIYARQWMAVFAEALKLGMFFDDAPLAKPVQRKLHKSTSLSALAASKCPETTIAESIALVESITKKQKPIGLVLDVKSRYISHRVWALVVDTLRDAGVRVEMIASFSIDEIRGISCYCAQPVQETIFFHSAGDLQAACHAGKIKPHDKIFFNAGSLLWDPADGVPANYSWSSILYFDPSFVKQRYQIHSYGLRSGQTRSSTIECYKRRYQLHIGLYCQEFSIDPAAATLLADYVNTNSGVFDLGLSWGGVNGITIKGIAPGRFTNTDGFWNQRYIGTAWNPELFPPGEEDEAEIDNVK